MSEENKNVKKNVNIENLTPFSKENQPSPEAKKKGWERRREAQKIMDEIMKLSDMPYSEIKNLLADIKNNPDKHTLREVKLANYLMEKKYTIDYLDRHISKAPQDINLDQSGTIKIIREYANEPTEDEIPEFSETSDRE